MRDTESNVMEAVHCEDSAKSKKQALLNYKGTRRKKDFTEGERRKKQMRVVQIERKKKREVQIRIVRPRSGGGDERERKKEQDQNEMRYSEKSRQLRRHGKKKPLPPATSRSQQNSRCFTRINWNYRQYGEATHVRSTAAVALTSSKHTHQRLHLEMEER